MKVLDVSPKRVAGLSLVNARLVARNRLTLVYAVALPLLPLGLLLVGDNSSAGAAKRGHHRAHDGGAVPGLCKPALPARDPP